ncbi:MAG: hypothetical protein AMJ65_06825 [Phycisphaerae bacterium SG8_4]|nr:MAG: hypothetical protein AMJ65_06825 [Phycisphaerae bacterium SG8_4]
MKYPTLRQAEKILKAAIPCDTCDCQHFSARLNIYRDNDTIRVTGYRLGCGKMGLVDLGSEDSPEVEEEDAADDES